MALNEVQLGPFWQAWTFACKAKSIKKMEITGEEHLSSNKARELFERGKQWLSKKWNVVSIAILPKTIGRNSGFIMDVVISNIYTPISIRYYAKIQSVHIETVMIHHLLKYTQCGPVDFLVTLLPSEDSSESTMHGVITRNATFDTVHSWWTGSDDERLFRTESMIFTIFKSLGRFGNLPDNHDNWGIAKFERKMRKRDAKTESSLMIIDFSSNRTGTDRTLHSQDRFECAWKHNIYTMFHCSVSSYEMYNVGYLAKLAKRIVWLYSKQALLNLLQRVCFATYEWLARTAAVCSGETLEPAALSYTSNASLPLTAFQKIKPPVLDMSRRSHYEIKSMLREYENWIYMWNVQLGRYFAWFPFPYEPEPISPPPPPPPDATTVKVPTAPAPASVESEDGPAPPHDTALPESGASEAVETIEAEVKQKLVF